MSGLKKIVATLCVRAGYLSFALPTHYCCQHYIYRSHLNKLGWRVLFFLSTPLPLRVLELYFAYFISFRFSAFFHFRLLLLLRFSMDAVKCLSILFKRMNGFDAFSYFFAHPKKEEEAAAQQRKKGREKSKE